MKTGLSILAGMMLLFVLVPWFCQSSVYARDPSFVHTFAIDQRSSTLEGPLTEGPHFFSWKKKYEIPTVGVTQFYDMRPFGDSVRRVRVTVNWSISPAQASRIAQDIMVNLGQSIYEEERYQNHIATIGKVVLSEYTMLDILDWPDGENGSYTLRLRKFMGNVLGITVDSTDITVE